VSKVDVFEKEMCFFKFSRRSIFSLFSKTCPAESLTIDLALKELAYENGPPLPRSMGSLS